AARAERNTTGMSRVAGSAASFSATSQPSTSGIITSRRTISGCRSRTRSSASRPFVASATASPSPSRLTRQMVRIAFSSSTRRTRGAASVRPLPPAPPPGPGRCRTRLRHVPCTRCGGRWAREERRTCALLDLRGLSVDPPFPPGPLVRTTDCALSARRVPLLRELAESRAPHPDRVARVQPHPRGEIAVARANQRAQRVLRAGEGGGDAGSRSRVVLFPIAVPAAPHLVDPPLGDAGAELRLVVDDRDRREELRPPAGVAQPAAEVGLLGVDEE